MKNTSACAKNLNALLKKIGPPASTPAPEDGDPVKTLVMSFLCWEATTASAAAGYEAIMSHVVDFNDLRVSMPHEVAEWLGPQYPLAVDRAQRLRAVLRNIYMREHTVSLEGLKRLGKREVRKYIESLEGIPPYVAARVCLLCFGAHAIPVDEQLRTRLVDAEAADPSVELPALAAWLSRQIKADDGLRVHCALQSWIDGLASKSPGRSGKSSSEQSSSRQAATGKKVASTTSAGKE